VEKFIVNVLPDVDTSKLRALIDAGEAPGTITLGEAAERFGDRVSTGRKAPAYWIFKAGNMGDGLMLGDGPVPANFTGYDALASAEPTRYSYVLPCPDPDCANRLEVKAGTILPWVRKAAEAGVLHLNLPHMQRILTR
jgi:hypothetical protein